MKVSFAIAVVILVVGGVLILRGQRQLSELRLQVAAFTVTARELEIFIEPGKSPSGSRYSSGKRENKPEIDDETRQMTVELIKMLAELQSASSTDFFAENLPLQIRSMACMVDLTPAQAKYVIGELLSSEDLRDKTRWNYIHYTTLMLADENPKAALELFTTIPGMGGHIAVAALNRLATESPSAALAWLNENGGKYPALNAEAARSGIIEGTARHDPSLAFKLIEELGSKDFLKTSSMIAKAAVTNETRTATVNAMRASFGEMEDGPEREKFCEVVLKGLGSRLPNQGFEAASGWLDQSGLSGEEILTVIADMNSFNTGKSTGDWISWMAEKIPGERFSERVDQMMAHWTNVDVRSAGQWLQQAPEDATKAHATTVFARNIAAHEPQVAEEWALTLSEEHVRLETLAAIRDKWPPNDPDGKAAFVERNGLDFEP